MGLETVKEEILNSAKEQSNSLIAEARGEANRIMKESETKIETMKEKSDAETKRMMDMIKTQELASAELENKKMLLEAKKQIIETVFIEAKKSLEGLDDKKRENYLKKLIEKAKNEIELMNVYCNKRDSKFLKGFNIETIDVIGGLMTENKEKTIRIDYSFETMLQSIKENELQNINKILFA
ncbi:MAG: V-type ATP synthase subunit E family protein [Nanoarchaeota archaeon]|nr:V-type ATP synthase subunit E family protein [Nanoarchaeota archaeon]